MPLTAVAMFLDREPRQVSELIDDGKIRWAFDIRSHGARQREIRVLRQSLFEFTGLYSPPVAAIDEETEFKKITDLILPRGTTLTAANVMHQENHTRGRNPVHVLLRLPIRVACRLNFPREPLLGAIEISKCFCCQSQHVTRLIHEKELALADLQRAPKASPLVTRASVISFLAQRRVS